QVMRARDRGEMCRRSGREIFPAIIGQGGITSVEIPGDRKGYDLRIQALGKGCFIGAIESLLTFRELVMKLSEHSFRRRWIGAELGGMVSEVDGGAEL